MYIKTVALEGLVGLQSWRSEPLERWSKISGSLAHRATLRSALGLALSAFDPHDADRFFKGQGQLLEPQELLPELTDELLFGDPSRLRGLVDPKSERHLKVSLTLELDPPQFAMLRELAFKDPVLAEAMGPKLLIMELKVGWVFTRDLSVGACSVLGLHLGGIEVPSNSEAFKALRPLLRGMAGRGLVRQHDPDPTARIVAADRSPELDTRAGLDKLKAAAARSPFNLGALNIVDGAGGPWLALGPELRPLQSYGPAAADALGLLADLYLDPCEILVLDRPGLLLESGPAVERWLQRLLETEGGPMEQLIVLGQRGEQRIEEQAKAPTPTRFSRFRPR